MVWRGEKPLAAITGGALNKAEESPMTQVSHTYKPRYESDGEEDVKVDAGLLEKPQRR